VALGLGAGETEDYMCEAKGWAEGMMDE